MPGGAVRAVSMKIQPTFGRIIGEECNIEKKKLMQKINACANALQITCLNLRSNIEKLGPETKSLYLIVMSLSLIHI